MAKKFLDYVGLQALWGKIKSTFATKDDMSKKADKNHKQAYITSELDTYTADDNIGVSAAGVKKCVNTFALGKTETAVKANGVTDYGDRANTINIGWSTSSLTANEIAGFACYKDGQHIKDASIATIKSILGVNDLAAKVNNAISTANSASSTASNADGKAQQAINQINSVNQDKITKGDLVFSLSGSTLTITKRY